jgi:hypothetical protein
VAVIKRNPDIQTFKPRWPDLTSLPLDQVRLTYDRPSDTFFVDFYGESRPAASVPLDRGDRDYLYARVDPETDAVVGLQIEHFLSYAIERHPELVDVLETSTLVGIGRDDLDRIARRHSGHPRAANIATLLEDLLRPSG